MDLERTEGWGGHIVIVTISAAVTTTVDLRQGRKARLMESVLPTKQSHKNTHFRFGSTTGRQ
jgi:hypothetical protein